MNERIIPVNKMYRIKHTVNLFFVQKRVRFLFMLTKRWSIDVKKTDKSRYPTFKEILMSALTGGDVKFPEWEYAVFSTQDQAINYINNKK